MKIAFDYGGTIETHPEIRELAKALSKEHEIYIISGVPESMTTQQRVEEVNVFGIDFKHIYTIFHPDNVDWKVRHAVGLGKAEIMKDIGCNLIIDNDTVQVKAIRSQGLEALQI